MKIGFIVLLFILSLNSNSQIVSFCFQPTDLGIGLKYDHIINSKTGIYLSATKGKYSSTPEIVSNHIKLSTGLIKYFKKETFLSFGTLYHHYTIKNTADKLITYPLSIEIGVGTFINRTVLSIRFDPIKWESTIDFGYKF